MLQSSFDSKVFAIHQLRVNIKSLTAEARIIRAEMKRAGEVYRNALAIHRRVRLREEMRYAHLALAFLRGRAYRSVERSASVPVSGSKLSNKVSRFVAGDPTMKIRDWLK